MTSLNMKEITENTYRELHFSDGFIELQYGIIFLCTSFIYFSLMTRSDISTLSILALCLMPALMIPYKSHITVPRIGYAVIPEKKLIHSNIITFVCVLMSTLGALFLGGLILIVDKFSLSSTLSGILLRVSPILIALLIGFNFLSIARETQLRFYRVSGIAMMLIGIIFSSTALAKTYTATHLMLLIIGIIMLLTGISKLIVFIRNNPLQQNINFKKEEYK